MPITLMGLYEDSSSRRDMHWFGRSEGIFEPHCKPYSPTMPHARHDNHKRSHLTPPNHDSCPEAPQDAAPLTPSASSSPLSASSAVSHATTFVGSISDQPPYVGPQESESPLLDMHEKIISIRGMSSPCPRSNAHGAHDLSTSRSSKISSVHHPSASSTLSPVEYSICAGCSGPIEDRFYLLAVERRWHARCLRCTICHGLLDSAGTCFSRDGNIFCKDDYQRLFPQRKLCARCGEGISSAELVMRARDFVYHVQCFSCAQCHTQLTKGAHFGMNGPLIYCREHYQIPNTLEAGCVSPLGLPPGHPFHGPALPPGPLVVHQPPPSSLLHHDPSHNFTGSDPMGKMQFFNGVGTPHKGRPRKRKPKEEPMDTNMNIPNGYDIESAYGSLSGSCHPVRTKRIRTSFKHHQLRTMKHYFGINHNPDAKDLKQLSQKTSLSKRVLQVWFQNARAKWRRQVIVSKDSKGEGGGSMCLDGSGAEGSGTEYNPNSPASAGNPLSPDTSSESGTTQLTYQHMF